MMKVMKTSLWMCLVGVCVLSAGQPVRADTIKMAWFELPPHMYADEHSEQPRGAGIAYFEAVAARMGYTVEWVGPLPLKRLLETVHNARDGVEGMLFCVKFPEPLEKMHFTDVPFQRMQASLAVREDNPLTTIGSIDDIEGYRIGYAMTGDGRYTPFLDAHRDRLHFEGLFGNDWLVRNFRMLMESSRLDAVFDRNPHSLSFEAARLGVGAQVKILPLPDDPVPAYAAFSRVAPRSERLVEAYNAAVTTMILSYDELLAREFEAIGGKSPQKVSEK